MKYILTILIFLFIATPALASGGARIKNGIDQSQVKTIGAGYVSLGHSISVKEAQQFLPTKNNLTGVIIRKGVGGEIGNFAGDVTISIQANSSGSPSGTNLGTPVTISNATWKAGGDVDIIINYPLTLTIDGSTTYWIVVTSSTADDSNYSSLFMKSPSEYNRGLQQRYNGSTWTTIDVDAYFKTLYSTGSVISRTSGRTYSRY